MHAMTDRFSVEVRRMRAAYARWSDNAKYSWAEPAHVFQALQPEHVGWLGPTVFGVVRPARVGGPHPPYFNAKPIGHRVHRLRVTASQLRSAGRSRNDCTIWGLPDGVGGISRTSRNRIGNGSRRWS